MDTRIKSLTQYVPEIIDELRPQLNGYYSGEKKPENFIEPVGLLDILCSDQETIDKIVSHLKKRPSFRDVVSKESGVAVSFNGHTRYYNLDLNALYANRQ